MSSFSDLFPALVECFVIILFGYISGRLNIISPAQGKGIGNFVGTFALPALLFKSMVELDFSTVSWAFMVAVLLGKTIVFLIVLVFSIVLVKPRGMGRGALYSIFTTQSNDFALGYPLIQVLYSKTHPEFLQYIYLLAPVSLLILNPVGFLLLEVDKVKNGQNDYVALLDDAAASDNSSVGYEKDSDVEAINEPKDEMENGGDIVDSGGDERDTERRFTKWTCYNIFKGVVLNPLVFMVFIGLIGHFVFNGVLPVLLNDTLTTLANAFSAAALFYLGLTMVGKVSKQKGTGLLIPASLIAAKIILLPILIRELVISLSNVLPVYHPADIPTNSSNMTDYIYSLADFGYLYGTFPTAPTVVIYAAKYGLEVDRLASGMVFCTSLSAPIMYISAWTLSMSRMSVDFFDKEVREVDKDISIISLFCSVWCIVIFIIGRKFLNVPHAITLSYICALFVSSLGTVLWDSINFTKTVSGSEKFVFGMMFFGVHSARLLSASMAVSLVIVLNYGQRWVWKHLGIFIAIPYVLAFLTTVLLMSCATGEGSYLFKYGQPQNIVSFVIILLSFLITVASLIFIIKVHGYRNAVQVESDRHSSRSSETLLQDFDDDFASSSTEDDEYAFGRNFERKCCIFLKTRQRFGDVQKVRHIVLLLLLILSMFIGLCLVAWKMTKMKQIGIFFEISFLDSVFNFGQAFFVFCVFGLDSDLIIDPFVRLWRKLRFGAENISLPHLSTVDHEILLKCLQFTRYHLDDCKLDILRDHRPGFVTYKEVFTGRDLCTWLVDRGLVNDRVEACNYGQNLMAGRVVYHHKNKHYFHDKNYLYKFEEPKTCHKHTRKCQGTGSATGGQDGQSSGEPCSSRALKSTFPTDISGKLPMSPAKKSFHGFSFEAYIMSSDTGSHFSPRRTQVAKHTNKDDAITVSVNNNCNLSDSSEGQPGTSSLIRKKRYTHKVVKKIKNKEKSMSSDSSI